MIKIYLDDGFASQHGGGIGVYTDLLFKGLNQKGYDVIRPKHIFPNKIKNPIIRRLFYVVYINIVLPIYLNKIKCNIAHFTNFQMPIIKNNNTKYICTVHDINPLLHSDTISFFYIRYFRIMIKSVLKKADIIVTVSQSVKNEILERFSLKEDKIIVCHNSMKCEHYDVVKSNLILQKYNLKPKEFYLFVGRLEKRKNIITCIKAFERFKLGAKSQIKLVLVGTQGYGYYDILKTINLCKYQKDIILTGYLPDANLGELYYHSLAFVFPSIYEGFGIPLLEAMQYNLPIILSNIPTNIEILDSRGFFFDMYDIDRLSEIFKKIAKYKRRSIDYSDILNKYSHENMINQHLEAYDLKNIFNR